MTKHCTSRLKNFKDDTVLEMANNYARTAYMLGEYAITAGDEERATEFLKRARRSFKRATKCVYELNSRGIPYYGFMYHRWVGYGKDE